MKFVLLTLLLIACGKPTTYTYSLPANTSSAFESSLLEEAITDIQNRFKAKGIEVNLNTIPIYAGMLDAGVAGVCYKDNGQPKAIVIDHSQILPASHGSYLPLHYSVLLHEIGHCFFNREHETELLVSSFRLIKYSAMYTSKRLILDPANLKDYYIAELAGLERFRDADDYVNYSRKRNN